MKRNLFILSILLAAIAFTGCSLQQTTYRESSARIVEPSLSAVITPLIADMELISEAKISPYSEVFPYEVTEQRIRLVEGLKRVALLNAAKEYGADVIVGALIDVETTPEGYFRITVTGYPARYVRFRSATESDLWLVDMYRIVFPNDNTILQGSEKSSLRLSDRQ